MARLMAEQLALCLNADGFVVVRRPSGAAALHCGGAAVEGGPLWAKAESAVSLAAGVLLCP
jgi:hypothetical protein